MEPVIADRPQGDGPVEVLSEEYARALLASQRVGRLVFLAAGALEIFPVNFVADDDRIVFRTAPGTKLLGAVIADRLAFEVDRIDDETAWSVVVHGAARMLDGAAEIAAAEQLPLSTIVPTVKRRFVAISIESISGRRFRVGAEPDAQPETIT